MHRPPAGQTVAKVLCTALTLGIDLTGHALLVGTAVITAPVWLPILASL
ncbi:MAG: hypothetical protein ACOCXJ_05285 [Planctomycetota bacterium]